MTTTTIARFNTTRPTHDPGFTDLLRSEWTKFRTLRSSWWSLGTMLVLSLGMSITLTAVFSAEYHDNKLDASKIKRLPLSQPDTIAAWKRGGMLAMPYQPGSPDVHLNTWVTMFASQAVALAVPDAEPLHWDQLV